MAKGEGGESTLPPSISPKINPVPSCLQKDFIQPTPHCTWVQERECWWDGSEGKGERENLVALIHLTHWYNFSVIIDDSQFQLWLYQLLSNSHCTVANTMSSCFKSCSPFLGKWLCSWDTWYRIYTSSDLCPPWRCGHRCKLCGTMKNRTHTPHTAEEQREKINHKWAP